MRIALCTKQKIGAFRWAFTLVEVLVAVMVMAIMFVGLYQGFSS